MARISKTYHFEAAHQLPGHQGKCARLHGHSYQVTVTLEGPIRPVRSPEGELASDGGMVEDFDLISRVVKPLIAEHCDHQFLNDSLPIPRTTAELIACWFFGAASQGLRAISDGASAVYSIELRETESAAALVFREDWLAAGRPGWPDAPLG
jgi:6-pyruvoyltetrahydropterin/6-carboxytetrahydropterin synthase